MIYSSLNSTLLFRCWLIINIPSGDRKKTGEWLILIFKTIWLHNFRFLWLILSISWDIPMEQRFSQKCYICANGITQGPSLSTISFNMNMMTQPRSWTPYIVWIRHFGMFWPNSLRGWVFNYSKNCSAHSALATADPWEHSAHCSRSLLGMSRCRHYSSYREVWTMDITWTAWISSQ